MNIIYMQLTRPFLATAHKGSCSGWIIWWGSTGHAVWQRAQETAVSQNESWQCKYRCFSRIFADIYIYIHTYIYISIYFHIYFLCISVDIPSNHPIVAYLELEASRFAKSNSDESRWRPSLHVNKNNCPHERCISNRTHVSRTPNPEYLIALAIYLGVRW